MTGSVNEEACHPVTLRIEAIRDGEIVFTGNHSLAPGQTIVQSVEVKILKSNSITVISTILDPFTQEQLAQGDKNETVSEATFDATPINDGIKKYFTETAIDSYLGDGLKALIDAGASTAFTDEVINNYANEHDILPSQVKANLEISKQALLDALEGDRNEFAGYVFGVLEPTFIFRTGNNNPLSAAVKSVLDGTTFSEEFIDRFKSGIDPLKPIAEVVSDHLSVKFADDLFTDLPLAMMEQGWGGAGDLIKDTVIFKKVGITLSTTKSLSPDEIFNADFSVFVKSIKVGGDTDGVGVEFSLDYKKENPNSKLNLKISGSAEEGVNGKSFNGGASLEFKY